MSKRSSSVSSPEVPPSISPTTPVFPTPVCTSNPSSLSVFGDDAGCADFFERKFRMRMQIASHRDEFRTHGFGFGTQLGEVWS